MVHRLGIDTQTVFGMPPVELVTLAADLGCGHVSTGLGPVPWKLDCFPQWSLRDDAALRLEMAAAMRDRGVSIALAEGFAIRPHTQARDFAADLDLFAGLGARFASSVSMDADLARVLDQFAVLADMTAERNMGFLIEFAPPHPINNLEQAVSVVSKLGRPNVGLVIDAMHLFRSGATVDELAAIAPGLIGYVQLCDVPLVDQGKPYMEEACFERMYPGNGELPLTDLLRVIPDDVGIGLEVPNRAHAGGKDELRKFIERTVEASRRLLGRSSRSGEKQHGE
jgi:sugar phosphate isomerase/epimerase